MKDHTAEGPAGTYQNAEGITGPKRPSPSKENEAGFKMYDGDGELYYEGVISGKYSGFEPLDDFGRPNAGCVSISIDGVLI